MYEVVWGKYLALFIGVTAYAHTVVLATFMGGLALGNAVFGILVDRLHRPLLLYALLELGVGLYCAVFPFLYDTLSGLYLAVASPTPSAWQNLALKIVFSAAALIVPTVLMGGTLPALSRYVIRRIDQVGTSLGVLYYVNSAGAALGCLLAGFYLVRSFGLDASLMLAATANVAVGLVFLWFARRPAAVQDERDTARTAEAPGATPHPDTAAIGVGAVFLLVFGSGAAAMIYEVAWIRLLSLAMGSSTYSFTIMLFAFIAGIAVGGFVAARLLRGTASPVLWFAGCQLGVFCVMALMLPLYERLPYYFNVTASMLARTPQTFGIYQFVKVTTCLATMAAPTVLIGMTLPLAGALSVRHMRTAGGTIGMLFSFNTLGDVLGAVTAGFVMLPIIGTQHTLQAAMLISVVLGAATLAFARWRTGVAWRVVPFAVVFCAWAAVVFASPSWHGGLLASGLYRTRSKAAASYEEYAKRVRRDSLLYFDDGAQATVAVHRSQADTSSVWLTVNGKPDASTGRDMATQLLLGHLPALLHDSVHSTMVIGYGSGVTAGALLRHRIARCDIAEISPSVIEASAFFSHVNGRPLEDPRAHLCIIDAREFLQLRSARAYDVIVSEPSNPWIAGIGSLFSTEFYAVAARRLKPGGLFVQWLHLYEMDNTILSVALNTLASVFPHITMWAAGSGDVIMLASLDPQDIDLQRLAARLDSPPVQSDLRRIALPDLHVGTLELLSLQVLSAEGFRRAYPGTGRLNSDRFPFLEYEAPRAFFMGTNADIGPIDQRRVWRESNDLYVSRLLRSTTETVEDYVHLAEVLGHRQVPQEARLRESILWRVADLRGRGTPLSSQCEAQTTPLDRFTSAHLLALGTSDWATRMMHWGRLVGGSTTPQDWEHYRRFHRDRVLGLTSVFYRPTTVQFEEAHARCVSLFPERVMLYEAQRHALYAATGIPKPAARALADSLPPGD